MKLDNRITESERFGFQKNFQGVRIPRETLKKYGVNGAILWCVFSYYQTACGEDDFCITQEQIKKDTGLSVYAITKAVKLLKNGGSLDVKQKGFPLQNYYKIIREEKEFDLN